VGMSGRSAAKPRVARDRARAFAPAGAGGAVLYSTPGISPSCQMSKLATPSELAGRDSALG